MEKIIEKIKEAEREMAQEKGNFTLFALLHREEADPDRWDLVVSAPWIQGVQLDTLRYIAGKLKSRLEDDEMVTLSMIVPLESSHQLVVELNKLFQMKQGDLEQSDFKLAGLELDHAHIITSNAEAELEAA